MNNTELKRMRKLLFFSVAEAAEDISKTKPRQWQRYEKGDRNTPDDIIDKMHWYIEFYHALLDSYIGIVEQQIDRFGKAHIPAEPDLKKRGDMSELAIRNIHESVLARIQADYLADVEIVDLPN